MPSIIVYQVTMGPINETQAVTGGGAEVQFFIFSGCRWVLE